jgi:hypothetical protein
MDTGSSRELEPLLFYSSYSILHALTQLTNNSTDKHAKTIIKPYIYQSNYQTTAVVVPFTTSASNHVPATGPPSPVFSTHAVKLNPAMTLKSRSEKETSKPSG